MLTGFGGCGALLYAVLWVLVPQRRTGATTAARAVLSGIARTPAIGLAVRIDMERVMDARAERRVTLSQFPGRPLPYRIAPNFRLDLGFAHAGVIIPRRVVGADMLEAKPEVAVKFEPRARCTKIAAASASRMVARAQWRLGRGLENRIDRNAAHRGQYGRRLGT